MKVDGELGFCQASVLGFVSDMGALESESCKEVVCDSKAISVSLSEQMSRDRLWNVNEFDCSTSDDSTNANEDEGRDIEEPYTHSSAPYKKEMDPFGNAKSVTECELPELLVCYKDNVVKDICVDEGVTSLGQLLFGQSADDCDIATTISPPEAEKDESPTHQCDSMQIEKSVPASVKSAQHLVTEDLQPEQSKDKNGANQLQSVQTSGKEAVPTLVPAVEESNNVSNKTTKNDNLCSVVDDTSKAETESLQNGDFKDGVTPDCQMVSNLVRQSPGESSFSVGESSFSAAVPFSGLITYSGPIAYSGSCSLRSDSSTTSARSFAFPVLQTEWNSSPVRMKAAHRRKHKGWRQGFLCCRF